MENHQNSPPTPLLLPAGVVSEQKSQTEEAGASLAEAPPPGRAAGPQGTVRGRARAGARHGPAVLPSASGSLTPPVLNASVRCVFPPPGPGRPVPAAAAATRRLVQPAEEQPRRPGVHLGLHAAPGLQLPLELRNNLEGVFVLLRHANE